MSDKVDDTDATPPTAPTRTLKLKAPRAERPATPAKTPPPGPPPSTADERPNFLTRIDQVKRQMQADMDALADPRTSFKKRP